MQMSLTQMFAEAGWMAKGVIIILLILSTGHILSIGFEKVYLMQNAPNLSVSQVISTYVYQIGLISGQFSYSSAIGLFNNLVNLLILLTVPMAFRHRGLLLDLLPNLCSLLLEALPFLFQAVAYQIDLVYSLLVVTVRALRGAEMPARMTLPEGSSRFIVVGRCSGSSTWICSPTVSRSSGRR